MSVLNVYSDGGSRGNPGPSACAFVVYDKEQLLYSQSFFLGRTTNNKAEYAGVVYALEWLIKNKKTSNEIYYYLDSQLIVKQLIGEYRVKDTVLKKMALKIQSMATVFKKGVKFIHILRDKNVVADKLLNENLDSNT